MPFVNKSEPIKDIEIKKIDRYYDDGTPVFETYVIRDSGPSLVYMTEAYEKRQQVRDYHTGGACSHPITKEYPGWTENQVVCSICGYVSYR